MFFLWPCLCKTGGQWPWWRRWRWWWGRRPGWLVSSCAGSGPWSVRVSTLSRSHSQCPHHLWKPGQWLCRLSLRGITPLPSGCKLIIVLFTVSLTENIWQSHPEDHGSTQHTCSRSPGNTHLWDMVRRHAQRAVRHTLHSRCFLSVSSLTWLQASRGGGYDDTTHYTLDSGHPETSVNSSDGSPMGGNNKCESELEDCEPLALDTNNWPVIYIIQ